MLKDKNVTLCHSVNLLHGIYFISIRRDEQQKLLLIT